MRQRSPRNPRKQANWPKKRKLKPRKPREKKRPRRKLSRLKRNEGESLNQSCRERSEDRHHRGWSRFPGRSRCCCRDARRSSFRFGEHENEGRSRYVRRKTVAAKRNWSRSCRLRFLADLARRRRRVWTEAA